MWDFKNKKIKSQTWKEDKEQIWLELQIEKKEQILSELRMEPTW